jgi:hypothetical protein
MPTEGGLTLYGPRLRPPRLHVKPGAASESGRTNYARYSSGRVSYGVPGRWFSNSRANRSIVAPSRKNIAAIYSSATTYLRAQKSDLHVIQIFIASARSAAQSHLYGIPIIQAA